jgi:hypothetical protein
LIGGRKGARVGLVDECVTLGGRSGRMVGGWAGFMDHSDGNFWLAGLADF